MPVYIVVEIQTNNDGTVGTLVNSYNDRNVAESKFHQVLSAAAISQLPVHSCVLMTNEGFFLDSKSYTRDIPEQNEYQEN